MKQSTSTTSRIKLKNRTKKQNIMQQIQVKSGFKNINKKSLRKVTLNFRNLHIHKKKKNQVPYHYITDGGKTQKKKHTKKKALPKKLREEVKRGNCKTDEFVPHNYPVSKCYKNPDSCNAYSTEPLYTMW